MTPSTDTVLLAASRIAHLAKRQVLPLEAASEIATILEAAVGWDGFRMFGIDPQTSLVNRLLGASENDASVRRIWLQTVYLAPPVVPYADLTTQLRHRWSAVAFQEYQNQSFGFPSDVLEMVNPRDHRRFYNESETPAGGVLFVGFQSRGRALASLTAYRRDQRRPFKAEEVSLISDLAGQASQVLEQSLFRERVLAAVSRDNPIDATGVLILGSTGEIEVLTPAGERWLDELMEPSASDRDEFPMAVWAAMRGLQESPGKQAFSIDVESRVGPVRVEAAAANDQGAIALVIAGAGRNARPRVPESWHLTPRQAEMVMMLVTGASNRELAEAMFVTENTVEWHLRQIYRQLEVRSRAHLQSRFFREVLLDGAHGTIPGGLTPE